MKKYAQEMSSEVMFYNMFFYDNCGWFCDIYTNALCRVNVDTAEISLETMIPFDGDNRPFQYGFIAGLEDVLILAPRVSTAVMLYNITDKEFQRVEIDRQFIEKVGAFNLFSGVEIYDGNAYLIPGRFPGILKLDLSTFEITYLEDWYEPLRQTITDFDAGRVIFARCRCRCGNKLYLPSWQNNKLMIFDLETEKYSFWEVPVFGEMLSDLCITNDALWVALRNSNKIVKINGKEETESIVIPELEGTGIAFIACCGRRLYIVPAYGNQLMCMNLDTQKCMTVCGLPMEMTNMPAELMIAQTNMLSCVTDLQARIWMYSVFDGKIYRCDDRGNVETFDAAITDQRDMDKRVSHYVKSVLSQGIAWEDNPYGLNELLAYIQTQDE